MEEQLYYKDALKLAQKDYRACVWEGKSPCLPVLDDFVSASNAANAVDLGIVQIPSELIVGTKTRGRTNAFSSNFMPILEDGTEFADKWKRLCNAHLTEGIRDPIKAYEYMNRYYVEEGNKRVSVLKFFDALTIPGHVIRILPEGSGDDVDIYNEFVEFYKYSKINFIEFTKKGSYALLQKALGKEPGEEWTAEEQSEFAGTYHHFKKAYTASGGDKLQSTVGDAMLSYIMVYGYPELTTTDTAGIKKNLSKMWEEVELHDDNEPIELSAEPAEEPKQSVLTKVLSAAAPKRVKVAFIHDGTPEKSGWVHDHEKGRNYVQRVFEDKIETVAYNNAMNSALDNHPDEVIKQAIDDGATIIFTTSPRLTQASLRAAVDNPDIIVFNCALNKSHRYIRSYYTRMYEQARFPKAASSAMSATIRFTDKSPVSTPLRSVLKWQIHAQRFTLNGRLSAERRRRLKSSLTREFTIFHRRIQRVSAKTTATASDFRTSTARRWFCSQIPFGNGAFITRKYCAACSTKQCRRSTKRATRRSTTTGECPQALSISAIRSRSAAPQRSSQNSLRIVSHTMSAHRS